MSTVIDALKQTYAEYRQDLKACEKKYRPGEGIFGIGHSIKDDPCHGQFDNKVMKIIEDASLSRMTSDDAENTIRFLFTQGKDAAYPVSAQLMLVAEERHIMLLIPFLSQQSALRLFKEYAVRYKPWERLPVQREVYKALRAKS